MTFSEALKQMGDVVLPASFHAFCENGNHPLPLCDTALLERIECEYGIFGAYLTPLKELALRVSQDPLAEAWGGWIAAFIPTAPIGEISQIPLPANCETPEYAYYRLLILGAALPAGIEAYRARGFSQAQIRDCYRDTFGSRTAISETKLGVPGLDRGGFGWLLHYVKGLIFPAGIFNVTPRELYEPSILLRNRTTGEYAVLLLSGRYHRSGQPLGSGACLDEAGAFDADFCETEKAFIGRAIRNGRAQNELCTYQKSEWQEIVRHGGAVAALHIPRGASLTEENIQTGFRSAFALSRRHFPELDVRAVHCSTWMLDPQLTDLLGEHSRINGFLSHFLKYPQGGDGAAVYPFVFQCQRPDDLHSLPEDTSLQRKVKALYLDGGCIYITGGYVPCDEVTVL